VLPNIVFILTDDEDAAIHAFLPKTKALLHDQGTTLSNFFVTYSLCCPSRASILRGQYPHNTHVESNSLPAGGYQRFVNLGLDQATIATWLQGAGYRTVFAGKYLNGYGASGVPVEPPGWSEWYGGMGDPPYLGYNYSLDENGTIVSYGAAAADFLTDVIAAKAVAAIHQAAHDSVPFFLYLAPFSPHTPAAFAPRHAGLFAGTPLPSPPNFNEPDVSDKPLPIRSRPLLNPGPIASMTALYQRRLRALQAIDDLTESIMGALAAEGLLGNTWIIYTSDNGYHLGEHRGQKGKNLPYEEDLRVPFVVRGPGVPAGRVVDAIALNIDLAPTFADLAGVQPTIPVDGRSLVPLLTRGSPAGWRQNFEAERGPDDLTAQSASGRSSPGGGQLELGDAVQTTPGIGWYAVRTARWTYVEWDDGERELYDLAVDPWELTNLFSTGDTAVAPALASRLHALMTCAGATCRAAENQAGP
jgi:N-acetylglucosamine-6-sulfatase